MSQRAFEAGVDQGPEPPARVPFDEVAPSSLGKTPRMAEDQGPSRGYACFAALQALFIVLIERGHIEGDDIR